MSVTKLNFRLLPTGRFVLCWGFIFFLFQLCSAQKKITNSVDSNSLMRAGWVNLKPISPKLLKKGKATEIELQLKSKDIKIDITGYVQLEIRQPQDSLPLDGWFRNIFPLQYFNLLPKKTSRLIFPIQAPADYEGTVIFHFTAFNKDHQIIGERFLRLDCRK